VLTRNGATWCVSETRAIGDANATETLELSVVGNS
jgi:hypothetical protein